MRPQFRRKSAIALAIRLSAPRTRASADVMIFGEPDRHHRTMSEGGSAVDNVVRPRSETTRICHHLFVPMNRPGES